jgi:plastocyanin
MGLRIGAVLSVACALFTPGQASAAVAHQHVIVLNEYLPSGTLSAQYTGEPEGLWNADSGYPIRAGDTITFTNLDTVPHTVTACTDCWPYPTFSSLFGSPFLTFGRSWTLDTTGYAPGNYRYFCVHHTFLMRGSFTVLAS